MYTSAAVYRQFKESLKNELVRTSITSFQNAWCNGLTNKTKFYDNFFKQVAGDMGGSIVYEQLRCDFTITDQEKIPLVLIEAENAHGTASAEVEQLCCLHAPVKVLVISCEWVASERKKYLPKWQAIIKKFNGAYPTNSKFCIVVGEWGNASNDDLRFYLVSMDSNGEVIEDLQWLFGTKSWD